MKARAAVGLVASLLILLSSAAHSFLGWKAISEQLSHTNVPADMTLGLHAGWQLSGALMAAIGLILLLLFVGRLRGQTVNGLPAAIIGAAYTLFGAWALAISGGDIFFAIMFVLPGVLLLIAAPPVSDR